LKKVGVARFPGSNCDYDVYKVIKIAGYEPVWLWYEEVPVLKDLEYIVLPGGFSYGDYLRAGALASRSPLMGIIKEYASKGGPVLGICNGFQILCEAGLLPGALVNNDSGRFVDKWVDLKIVSEKSYWTGSKKYNENINLPIAHSLGKYVIGDQELKALKDNSQIWLTYSENPNGSNADIAGITNSKGNVCGLMPHPERAYFDFLPSTDGRYFF
jgi:phosphoribosylformylglycinamidine synthase subunit PurQ / glutaminase